MDTSVNYRLIAVTDPASFKRNRQFIDSFFSLYEHEDNFPDPDEREPKENIIERVESDSMTPKTLLLMGVNDEEVIGGLIAEYYPKSSCFLLTYIFVKKSCRDKKIAKKLLDDREGLKMLIANIEQRFNEKVNAVFFETNNPFETEKDSIDPSERLLILSKLGGKRIDINYIQPPLNIGLGAVGNLYLCVLPSLTGNTFLIPNLVIIRFLVEFYYYLRVFHPKYSSVDDLFERDLSSALDLKKFDYNFSGFKVDEIVSMFNDLKKNGYEKFKDFHYLLELPKRENPLISFERASVALQFLIDESYYEPDHAFNSFSYCNFTHSFETDLFSSAYQLDPPYYTETLNTSEFNNEVIVLFPSEFDFISEGRRETFYSNVNEKFHELRLKLFVNSTYLEKSKIRVWHLVFSAIPDIGINEYDLIKLMKFVGGAQEIPGYSDSKFYHKHSSLRNELNNPAYRIQFKIILNNEEYVCCDVWNLLVKVSGVNYKLKNLKYKNQFHQSYFEDYIKEGFNKVIKKGNVNSSVQQISSLISGVVQIDTDFFKLHSSSTFNCDPEELKATLENMYEKINIVDPSKETVADTGMQDNYHTEKLPNYVFKSFCGITLGIFDFERMGFEEVRDTLIPRSSTTTSFLTINRSIISSFGYDDQVLASSYHTIGINPYLIIPSAVLAANEFIAYDAYKRIDSLINLIKEKYYPNKIKVKHLFEIREVREDVLRLIERDFVSNVFQYPTEKDIYSYGLVHRGIYELKNRILSRINELDRLVEEVIQRSNQKFQFIIAVASVSLAFIQFVYPITEFAISDYKKHLSIIPKGLILVVLLILLVILIIFIYHWLSTLGIGKSFSNTLFSKDDSDEGVSSSKGVNDL